MRPFSEIKSCLEVTDDDIKAALAPARSLIEPGPRERSLALVTHMTKVAKPWHGAPKILLVLAHVATRDWLEGELVVKVIGDEDVSVLELFVDDGLVLSRILGPLPINAAFREFRAVLALHAGLLLPLVIDGSVEERRVELRAARTLRQSSAPPSFSALSASLLPMVGGAGRAMPAVLSRPPPSAPGAALRPPALPADAAHLLVADEVRISDAEARPRKQYKALSLPPHLKAALAPHKKK